MTGWVLKTGMGSTLGWTQTVFSGILQKDKTTLTNPSFIRVGARGGEAGAQCNQRAHVGALWGKHGRDSIIGLKTTTDVQELCTENYNHGWEIKEDLDKLRDMLCAWIKSLNIIKISILPKPINRFHAISIKITAGSFVETDKLILKVRTQNS